MDSLNSTSINKVPFIAGNILFVIFGIVLYFTVDHSGPWVIVSFLIGITCTATPFIVEYVTKVQFASASESQELQEMKQSFLRTAQHIQNLENNLQIYAHEVKELRELLSAFKDKKGDLEQLKERLDKLDDHYTFLESSYEKNQTWVTRQLNNFEKKFTGETDSPLLNKAFSRSETKPDANPSSAQDEGEKKNLGSPSQSEGFKSTQDDLIAVEPSKKFSRSTIKNATTLVVKTLIGIGNKPYLRGTGGGLHEDQGVLMEFIEIGKWRWLNEDNTEVISCRVYKNDEVPAEGDPITIEPGESLELNVKFPV